MEIFREILFIWTLDIGALLWGENVNLYLNFAEGTTAKVQGTTAIAVGAVGYFQSLALESIHSNSLHASLFKVSCVNSDPACPVTFVRFLAGITNKPGMVTP